MKNLLKSFLDTFSEMDEALKSVLLENIKLRFAKKGEILVREGESCKECYFVLKGCIRNYELKNGDEHSIDFFIENEAAVLFHALKTGKPSESFLVCNEDTVMITGNPEEENEAYRDFPELEKITRKMMESDMGKLQQELSQFKQLNAEERYLNLLNNKPALLKRVPQHQIATYLGISPESLSRIRRKLSLQS